MRIVRVLHCCSVVFTLCMGVALVGGLGGCGGSTAAVTTPPINEQQAKASRDYFKKKVVHKKTYRR